MDCCTRNHFELNSGDGKLRNKIDPVHQIPLQRTEFRIGADILVFSRQLSSWVYYLTFAIMFYIYKLISLILIGFVANA